jgi:C4-dicarboxylate-binding protein DctP
VTSPSDVSGLRIRVLSVQEPAFRALGADVGFMQITETIPLLADGTFDGQENPFENIVAYGAHPHQRYYTTTFHSYMSRPIFVHRPTFDAWPVALQEEMRAAVRAAIVEQRALHDQAEIDAQEIIREAGGEIIELTPSQRAEFVAAVQPVYAEARSRYDPELLGYVGL